MNSSPSHPIAARSPIVASLAKNPALVMVLALACVVPIVGESLTHWLGGETRWINIPVHAVVEALGFFAGVLLARLLVLLRRYNNVYEHHLWTASGLVAMGILDGFHAANVPSQTFIWLHSIATFLGGALFCMIWLPAQVTSRLRDKWIVGVSFAGSVVLGAASQTWPAMVPAMSADGNFTAIAIAVNFLGGLGFLAAAAWFLSRQRQALSMDNYFFAVLSLLFGMAGLFFGMSRLWDLEWWLWHMLRLLAYLVVLGQTFRLYKWNLDELRASAVRQERQQHLEELVAARTAELTTSEAALRESRDKLEERVRERTADLQTANAALIAEKAHQEMLVRKLEEAQNQLLQSEKMASIGQLAAGVAHEINNPVGFINSNVCSLEHYLTSLFRILDTYEQADSLAGISGKVGADVKALKEELDYAYLKEDIFSLIRETRNGVERVKKIVADLKDFSHVGEAEWQFADLHKGLDSTLNVVNNEIKYKADVIKEYGELPKVECLPFQLNQVFMNLLVNASHAIAEHGTITLRTGREADEVWVEIGDTGCGIGPENMTRIFEPFFTTKPVGKGTGLGLSLSYGIVEKHHGRIEVVSEPGTGTTFRVWLPLKRPLPAAV